MSVNIPFPPTPLRRVIIGRTNAGLPRTYRLTRQPGRGMRLLAIIRSLIS